MNATGTEQWNWDDSSGQRVMQRTSVGGTVSYTVYAFGLEEHQYHASGTNTGNTSSYSVGGHLIGEQTGTSTKTTTFLLTDLLGSVVASFSNTAGSAAVQGNRAYSPYGAPLYQQGSVGTSKGFTGQYADSTSGLDYDNARYYDPLVGQFVSADSVQGNLGGMDPYAYVGGNPETKTDPSGHCPWCIIGAVVGAVAGAAIDYGMQVYNNYQSGKSNP
jgi:RHS repeat-associated protein